MSGYLERIIAAAKVSASAIRPLVRPLFAPSTNERFAGIAEEESTPSFSPPPAYGASREPLPRANPPTPGPVNSIAGALEEGTPPATFGEIWRPDAPPKWLMPVPVTVAFNSPDSRSAEPTTPLPKEFPAAVNTDPQVTRGSEVPGEIAFQPLMPVAPMTPRLNPVARFSAPVPPATDDIQIHIGRIEINAIPPSPAPRAPTSRASRGLNLDDYLRRGRGKAQ